jgi:hypothetical protein
MNHLLTNSLAIACLALSGLYATNLSVDAAPNRSTPRATAKPKPEAAKQTIVNNNTVQDAGIRYTLAACRRAEAKLICRFSLLNKNSKDVAVSLTVNGTRFIDKDGEEYASNEVQIGSVKSESEAENTLISDVPTKASVTFDAPPANVATMAVLVVNHSPGSTLKFRNVKITK